jgi:2-polyprenyl-6-methoxyphenol hydroxylase-like FAD-dependent oxidoreductase
MRVLVIGAGLGGLCLAHGLRQADIDVHVMERRPNPHHQPASYGIHLNANGLAALHDCLPPANWHRLAAAAVPAPDVVRFHDEQLAVLAVHDHEPADPDPITGRRAIRRDALHDALLLGLDDAIRWNSRFHSYTCNPDGSVRVTCTDGTEHVADLVVGADGVNSTVRGQRLPDLHRVDLGILNIAGRVPLTPQLRSLLPATLIDGAVNNIVPAQPGWMFVSTWNAQTGSEATEFAVWAWAADRGTYPAHVESLNPAQLRDLVADQITDWSPALRHLIDATDPATVGLVPLRTMPALDPWQPSPVTLLGDAIHNMTPMAGIGANTALRDADTLRRALLKPGPLVEQVGHYEQQMRAYANQALALSTRNARNAASSAHIPRLAFRTVLRVAQARSNATCSALPQRTDPDTLTSRQGLSN